MRRGSITGAATGLGGMLHTFPFLIPDYELALKLAYVVVACELVAIAFIRCRFMGGQLAKTIIQVVAEAPSCLRSASGSVALASAADPIRDTGREHRSMPVRTRGLPKVP